MEFRCYTVGLGAASERLFGVDVGGGGGDLGGLTNRLAAISVEPCAYNVPVLVVRTEGFSYGEFPGEHTGGKFAPTSSIPSRCMFLILTIK